MRLSRPDSLLLGNLALDTSPTGLALVRKPSAGLHVRQDRHESILLLAAVMAPRSPPALDLETAFLLSPN